VKCEGQQDAIDTLHESCERYDKMICDLEEEIELLDRFRRSKYD